MDRSEGIELQRRNLAAFIRLLGSASAGAFVVERDGVLASVVPAVPHRSVVNSVVYRDAASLAAALDEVASAFEKAGIAAWTVWVPEDDREAAAALEAAGHRLDAAPAAMVMDLERLPDPEPGDLDWDADADPREVGRINDHAYGLEPGGFGGALAEVRTEPPLRLYRARTDGEPVCVLGTIDDREDCGVYFVATLKGHRGRALARRLLHVALAEARERGCRTSSLQSSPLGYPVYDRLGYETICALEMWERRA